MLVREVWGSIPRPIKWAQCHQRLAIAAAFVRRCVAPGAKAAEKGLATRYALRCNTTSVIKDLIFFARVWQNRASIFI